MDRLTYRINSGAANLRGIDEAGPDKVKKSVARQKAFDRLAAYEDTGLEPDEIPHWIPVSERLPEQDERNCGSEDLLIAIKYASDTEEGNISIICTGYYMENEWWSYSEHGCNRVGEKWEGDKVTYWQPLPQPPKGEKP